MRPLSHIATATLITVVKRGKYSRYGAEFERQLQNELAIRRLEERRK